MFGLNFSRSAVVILIAFSLLPVMAFGQGATSYPTTNLPSHLPSEMNRPVTINGQVLLNDGTALTEPVEILRVCGGMVRREKYTDAKGKFSIILDEGSTNKTFQGASEGGGTNEFGAQTGGRVSQTTRTVLWGCEIRASLPGYTSSSVSLAGKDFSRPVTIAPIVLHRVTGVIGNSISVVSAKAPENARKEFEKGREAFLKKKYSDAEKHLAKAVELYPEYSSAWELRGREQRLQRRDDEAVKCFQAAISADEKFIPPYIQLAGLNASRGNWSEVLSITGKVIGLDPVSYPDAYFLNAFAYYSLKQMPEAENSARKAVGTDKDHRFPRAELLLGRILQGKGDDAGAAEHLRNYLKMEPNSAEAANIQAFLAQFNDKNSAAKDAPKAN